VSIVLPTFNRLTWLRLAVESVLAQSFTDWELVIADDGSGEETRAYLSSVATANRVNVLWLSHTGRPAVVRNAALRRARGQFVAFLDSDDVWLPSKLEMQVRSLRSHSARKWACTGYTVVDAAGHPRPPGKRRSHHDPGWPSPAGWIVEPLVKMEAVIVLPSVLACRSLIEDVGGFDESMYVCEDYDLWLRLAARSEIDVVSEPLVLVRKHDEHYAGGIDMLEGWRTVLEKARGAGLGPRVNSILRRERARIASRLARSHAVCGSPGGVRETLLHSWQYSWRYPHWWLGALAATARLYAPAGMRRAISRYRVSIGAGPGASS
jgi:glycosyltransferase involved in cell wall biosynthesis